MGLAFVALKRGEEAEGISGRWAGELCGQGGFEGASPQRAVIEKPTRPPAPFQYNPKGCKQRPALFNQWYLKAISIDEIEGKAKISDIAYSSISRIRISFAL